MESILCGTCRRKLAEADITGRLAIKCPRCGAVNQIQRATSPLPERRAGLAGSPTDCATCAGAPERERVP
ncbi:Com family DNA-binding transcriptional regulator [Paramagnetospirillum caucaseum]|uniref:Com family DNA-binding transcriptional regulator n=1 Tax=Paramagnetospirillum caucaseum TaxID=1244869 RepID=UPI0038995911